MWIRKFKQNNRCEVKTKLRAPSSSDPSFLSRAQGDIPMSKQDNTGGHMFSENP